MDFVSLTPASHPYSGLLDHPFLSTSLANGLLSQRARHEPAVGHTAQVAGLLYQNLACLGWCTSHPELRKCGLEERATIAIMVMQAINCNLPTYCLLTMVPSLLTSGHQGAAFQLSLYPTHASRLEVREPTTMGDATSLLLPDIYTLQPTA